MRKDFLKILFFGLLGGLLGGYTFIFVSDKYSANISQAIIPTPIISIDPTQGFWDKIVFDSSFTSLGIQVFQSDKLIKQGSGAIVSSDGFVVTVADLLAPSAVYQIFYGDKILRGTLAAWDYNLNLALIKTDSSYSNVADLNDREYRSGEEIVLAGKLFDVSKPVIFSQRGTISYVTDKIAAIDTVVNKNLPGVEVIDSRSNFIGLAYLRNGRVNLIRAVAIENFFREYLNKK